jgi:hypothetical protein
MHFYINANKSEHIFQAKRSANAKKVCFIYDDDDDDDDDDDTDEIVMILEIQNVVYLNFCYIAFIVNSFMCNYIFQNIYELYLILKYSQKKLPT